MNARFLLLIVGVAALSSCSSVYKTGQTPDDVYYSPAPPQEEYVQVQKNQDRYRDQSRDRYQTYEEYQDNYRNDRFLRMSIGNPYYMSAYNMYGGFDWRYNSLAYDFYNPWNPWNSYWYWNSFYNPYCSLGYGYHNGYGYGNAIGYYGYKQPLYTQYVNPVSRPLSFNPGSYYSNGRTIYSRSAAPANNSYYRNGNNNTPRYNNSNFTQRVFNNTHNNNSYTPSNNNNNTYTPSRSYTPSSSSSSGSSSSGSSSGSVSRPGRGGN